MIKVPVVIPKFSLHKHLLIRAIAIERAQFDLKPEGYQHLKQKIVAHQGGSRLEPTAEQLQAWREALELTRQGKICRQNIF